MVPAWLGVGIRALSPRLKQRTGTAFGVLVTEVYERGPADVAGIQAGDIILRFNDTPVNDVNQLSWLSNTAGVGNIVTLQMLRGDNLKNIKIKVQPKPFAAHR